MDKFLLALIEDGVIEDAKIMGYSDSSVVNWQKSRVLVLIMSIVASIVIYVLGQTSLALFVIIAGVGYYKYKHISFKGEYVHFDNSRQADMNRFQTLLIPYLYSSTTSLHTALSKCHERLENGPVKSNLERFIVERADNPGKVEPYREFAERSSGTFESDIFMSILFDFQNDNGDTAILTELSKVANEKMFENTGFIVDRKIGSIETLSLLLVVNLMVVIVGLVSATVLGNILEALAGQGVF